MSIVASTTYKSPLPLLLSIHHRFYTSSHPLILASLIAKQVYSIAISYTMILSTFSKTSLAVVAASALLLLSHPVESHSWIHCVDWQFNKPGVESWLDKDGVCRGYPRRFPVNAKPFAKLDSFSPHRHFEQKHDNPESQPSCSNGKNGKDSDTFDETLGSPVESAYGTATESGGGSAGKSIKGTGRLAKDDKSREYGPMAVKKAGDKLCIRWPAKNHAKDTGDTPVFIGLSGVNPTADPSQKEFSTQPGSSPMKEGETAPYTGKTGRIAALDYGKCSTAASDASDASPCGGCITLPADLQAGYYTMQWRWMLNKDEWYTSCADIKIEGGAGGGSNSTQPMPSSSSGAPQPSSSSGTPQPSSTEAPQPSPTKGPKEPKEPKEPKPEKGGKEGKPEKEKGGKDKEKDDE